ncbi:hypothetical protein FO488_15935 [Geobacter sp. FeAm09]|uniref:hypothetical protein n=1 Tax=Geobacter sp. FeAm09 TaxID=2597769 RepID=UPI0011EE1AC2|nr:hypothetical protein [Geobacter sp. FeAm09]QEM69498.1 hypothetical protein FO488_15935 [Geobacter sp. FeAm09]
MPKTKSITEQLQELEVKRQKLMKKKEREEQAFFLSIGKAVLKHYEKGFAGLTIEGLAAEIKNMVAAGTVKTK